MVVVAQLVRAPDCGSGGRRFETDLPPKEKPRHCLGFFVRKHLVRMSCNVCAQKAIPRIWEIGFSIWIIQHEDIMSYEIGLIRIISGLLTVS